MRKKSLVILGRSFNPPGNHHVAIAKKLKESFDLVVIIPCGGHSDKKTSNKIYHEHRRKMVELAFSGIENVGIDFHDLKENVFTRNYALEYIYENLYPDYEIWHFIVSDILEGGCEGMSQIHTEWYFGGILWSQLNFAILERPGSNIRLDDLPPNRMIFQIKNLAGSSAMIRDLIRAGKSVDGFVNEKILAYIKQNSLYLD